MKALYLAMFAVSLAGSALAHAASNTFPLVFDATTDPLVSQATTFDTFSLTDSSLIYTFSVTAPADFSGIVVAQEGGAPFVFTNVAIIGANVFEQSSPTSNSIDLYATSLSPVTLQAGAYSVVIEGYGSPTETASTFSVGGTFSLTDRPDLLTTVSAVPEPETYAMLLAGLGMLGFTARRLKKS